ncbi:hypothetical protein SAMN06265367_10113 [Algoriphagus winogradskyi]|uniref:Uncharacterized protein n=3 Tax=Algoriphagus winogradskyi TaxID=237017 RepID=A0ABY1N648_9BACT|nr:hypothetical protein SAMN06265367_10113 [Algoriphagus winogradskyi]
MLFEPLVPMSEIILTNKDHKAMNSLRKITNYSEGLTSLIAGTYVLSLALSKKNIALKVAFGVAGAYLILRSGGKLNSDHFTFEDKL